MRHQALALVLTPALSCLSVWAQAATHFTATDFQVQTSVTAANLPNQLSRQKQTNTPVADSLDGAVESSRSHADISAGLSISGSASTAAGGGRGVSSGSQAVVLNRLVLVPKAGFTGASARVAVSYRVTGQLDSTCSGRACSWATGGMSAQILTTRITGADGVPPRLDYSKHVSTNAPGGRSLSINEAGKLEGTAPINLPLFVQMNVGVTSGASSDGDPINGYTSSSGSSRASLGICASSADAVTIYWASDLFSPVQPVEGCPPPGPVAEAPTPGPDQGPGNVCDTTPGPDGKLPICGFADTHTHQFANLGFGGLMFWGSPFHQHGQAAALQWCDFADVPAVNQIGIPLNLIPSMGPDGSPRLAAPVHGAGGIGDLIGTALGQGLGHRVGGHPQYDGWPRWNTYTHQQMYVDWLHRAFQGGLKLMVMHAVNNSVFCRVSNQMAGFGCNDMEATDRQINAAKALEQYVDSMSGGPGKGWYRIVYTPQQAREAIAKGQLAVVLGIEVDNLLNCTKTGGCTEGQIRDGLGKYYSMGVRHIYPVHVFDNGYGGAALYNGAFNYGNKIDTGDWLTAYDCSTDGVSFQLGHPTLLGNLIAASPLSGGLLPPPYVGHGQCNTRGLTPTGQSLLRKSMSRKFILEVDHMSKRTLDDTLQIAVQHQYPLIGGHTGFLDVSLGSKRSEAQKTREQMNTIYGLGGMVGVITEQGKSAELATVRPSLAHDCGYSSKSWAQMYLYGIQLTGGAPVAIATDFNGFAGQPAPRFGEEACNGDKLARQSGGVHYPFSIVGGNGAKLDRSVIGHKNFDYNYDGLAHIGMVPDFIQDLRSMGVTDNDLKPLFRSAEGYIRMWEKIHSSSVFPPQTTITLVAANAAGWHKSNVTLILLASANQDGWNIQSLAYGSAGAQAQPETIVQHTGMGPASAAFPVTTEGTTTVSFTATDSAGIKSQAITRQVKLDKTVPVIIVNGNAGTYTVDQMINITCSISDTLSGLATASCPPIQVPAYTLDAGTQSRSVSATDIAGNTATATVTFTIAVNSSGMTNLITMFIGQSGPQLVGSYKALLEQISRAGTAAAKPAL